MTSSGGRDEEEEGPLISSTTTSERQSASPGDPPATAQDYVHDGASFSGNEEEAKEELDWSESFEFDDDAKDGDDIVRRRPPADVALQDEDGKEQESHPESVYNNNNNTPLFQDTNKSKGKDGVGDYSFDPPTFIRDGYLPPVSARPPRRSLPVRTVMAIATTLMIVVLVVTVVTVVFTRNTGDDSGNAASPAAASPAHITLQLEGITGLIPGVETMEALETVCRDFLEVTECELQSQQIVDLERQQRMLQTAQQALQIAVEVTTSSTTLENGTEEEFYIGMFEQSGDVFVQDLSQADPFFAPLVGVLLLLVDDGTTPAPIVVAAPSTTNAPTTSLTNAPTTRVPANAPPPPPTNAPTPLAGVVIIPVPSRTTAPTTGPCRVCRDPGDEVGNPEGLITIGGNSTTCGLLQMAIIPNDQCFQVQAFAGLTCDCRPVMKGPTTAPSPSPVMAGLPTAIDPAWTEAQSTIESLLGGSLSDPSFGPYLQAFNWLQNEDPLQLTPSTRIDLFLQRFFTVYLYFATTVNGPWPFCNPPNTSLNEDDFCVYEKRVHPEAPQNVEIPWVRFLTNRTECEWVGIFCDDFGLVNALDFSNFRITAQIPGGIRFFPALQSFKMNFNDLIGMVPSVVGDLSNLSVLELSYNKLSGQLPFSIYSMTSLQRLSLGSNLLTGLIQPEIESLRNLTVLALQQNKFIGTLPSQIGNLGQLNFLRLNENDFSGTIGAKIASLPLLRDLWLHSNAFTGTIPLEIGSAGRPLEDLRLSRNQLSGTIPDSLYQPEFLARIDLSENNLSGNLSPLMGQLTKLHTLNLGLNRFSGTLPAAVSGLARLIELDLSENTLTGTIASELGLLLQLEELYLNGNFFSGPVPTELGSLFALKAFRIDSNNLSGLFPSQLCTILSNVAASFADCGELAGAGSCVTFCCADQSCVCVFEQMDPLRCVQ